MELLNDTGQLGCKPRSTLMDYNAKLSKDEVELLTDSTMYRRLLGRLQYLTITRLDLSFAVNKLSQHMESLRICTSMRERYEVSCTM